ncbi:GlsB/YeaQ/YmgE family stress response membrane protein [Xylophilus sp. GOD-11R]|uniref:GlsB/YeaQ/YmgE family stress response membrane protein n=1 Tax=Xylophilus sp. GOD-11R TaxID=3089814 RepID=UPI00298CC4BB|nr:GlsB/YeaQ/YmgE family stress response membrane protein [Xylophilus sp. GOD-11R]WPB59409.1 GlsB/YeaQ/YmgE family stress response membrane protein [Xylophilus sp. GOD-11R]
MAAFITTIVIGLIVGLIARALMPGRNTLGFILTAGLGIAGSLLATFAGQALGLYPQGAVAGFIASILGAVVVLAVYGYVVQRRI